MSEMGVAENVRWLFGEKAKPHEPRVDYYLRHQHPEHGPVDLMWEGEQDAGGSHYATEEEARRVFDRLNLSGLSIMKRTRHETHEVLGEK